jgi:hypothetical protein
VRIRASLPISKISTNSHPKNSRKKEKYGRERHTSERERAKELAAPSSLFNTNPLAKD